MPILLPVGIFFEFDIRVGGLNPEFMPILRFIDVFVVMLTLALLLIDDDLEDVGVETLLSNTTVFCSNRLLLA